MGRGLRNSEIVPRYVPGSPVALSTAVLFILCAYSWPHGDIDSACDHIRGVSSAHENNNLIGIERWFDRVAPREPPWKHGLEGDPRRRMIWFAAAVCACPLGLDEEVSWVTAACALDWPPRGQGCLHDATTSTYR